MRIRSACPSSAMKRLPASSTATPEGVVYQSSLDRWTAVPAEPPEHALSRARHGADDPRGVHHADPVVALIGDEEVACRRPPPRHWGRFNWACDRWTAVPAEPERSPVPATVLMTPAASTLRMRLIVRHRRCRGCPRRPLSRQPGGLTGPQPPGRRPRRTRNFRTRILPNPPRC